MKRTLLMLIALLACIALNVGDYSVSDTELTVPQSELKSAASVFANWKKGL